jgi:GT2 family glycosyltransferase
MPSDSVDLSIVMACFNGAPTIREQLDSLLAQETDANYEVVVADNGSRDASREIVAEYARRDPRIRLEDASGRPGLSYARNRGVRASGGRAVAFCDQDDRVGTGWISAMTAAIDAHSFVAGRLEHDLLNELWTIEVRGRPQSDQLLAFETGRWFPFAFGCTLGLERSLHERIGGFDESFPEGAEDADYCWRLQLLGVPLVFVPAAVTHYRFRDTYRGLFRQARAYGRSEVRLYVKHLPLGVPRLQHPLLRGTRQWLGTAKAFARAGTRRRLGVALWLFGLRVGRLRQSVAEGVVFL